MCWCGFEPWGRQDLEEQIRLREQKQEQLKHRVDIEEQQLASGYRIMPGPPIIDCCCVWCTDLCRNSGVALVKCCGATGGSPKAPLNSANPHDRNLESIAQANSTRLDSRDGYRSQLQQKDNYVAELDAQVVYCAHTLSVIFVLSIFMRLIGGE